MPPSDRWTPWFRRALPIGVWIAFLSGCSGDGSDPDAQFAVRDSAGVEIVENAAPAWGSADAWSIAPRPSVSIDGAVAREDGPDQTVVGAVRLSDGRVVLADAAAMAVRIHGPDGAPLSTLEAAELGLPTGSELAGLVRLAGDSVAVLHSPAPFGFTLLAPDGSVHSVAFSGIAEGGAPIGAGVRYRASGHLSGGRFLLAPDAMVPPPTGQPGDAELRVPVLALSRNGELGPAPGDAARFRVFRADLAVPFPLSARTASRGMGGRLYQSHGWTREVRVFSAEGSIVQIVRRLDPGAPLTEASWTSELERLAAVTEAGSDPIGEDQAAALRVLYSGIARPDRFPASGDLHVDPSGHIWLQTFVRPGSLSVQNWSVFTPEGRWLGELRVIAGIRVFEIGEDYILGLITDPLGEERLQLFELDKPDRSRP